MICFSAVPPEKLWVAPDCGFSQTARWAALAKLRNMVAGARLVRAELTGEKDDHHIRSQTAGKT